MERPRAGGTWPRIGAATVVALVAAAVFGSGAGAGSTATLPAPTGLAASVNDQPFGVPLSAPQGAIVVTWTDVPGAVGYEVFRGTSSGTETAYVANPPTSFALTGDENGFADGGVYGTTYYYEIQAIGPSGQRSPLSNEVSVRFDLPAPTGVVATAAPGQVTIAWNATATSYSVYDSTTSGGEDLSGSPACTTSSTSCVISGLSDGTPYSFVVVGSFDGSSSRPSAEVTATPGEPAPALVTTQFAPDGATLVSASAVFGDPSAFRISPFYSLSLASVPSGPVDVEVTTSSPLLALSSPAPNFLVLQPPFGGQPGQYLVAFTPADAQIPVDIRISTDTSCPQPGATITNSVVGGSSDYLSVPSRTLPVTVNAGYPACAASIAESADPVNPSDPVTYAATVTPFGGTVSIGFPGRGLTYRLGPGPIGGVITFSDNGVPIPGCTALPAVPNAPPLSGQATGMAATCTQAYPSTGHHLIGVAYYSFGEPFFGAFQQAPLDASATVGETIADCGVTTAGCNLKEDDFTLDYLVGADLAGANLLRANLTSADLKGANLAGANLNGADLTGANLQGAVVNGANFNKAVWSNTTCPDGTNSAQDGGTCAHDL